MSKVVLNPVRAGLVAEAGDWPWSSDGSMVGTTSIPHWLETDCVLSQFGRDRPRAQFAYIEFVRAGIGLPSILEALRNQIYLGSDGFPEKVSRGMRGVVEISREVPRAQRRSPARTVVNFGKAFDDRREAMAQAYLSGSYTLR